VAVEVQLHAFLISAAEGGKKRTESSGRFTPESIGEESGTNPGTGWILQRRERNLAANSDLCK
jgi:hypothetical protein